MGSGGPGRFLSATATSRGQELVRLPGLTVLSEHPSACGNTAVQWYPALPLNKEGYGQTQSMFLPSLKWQVSHMDSTLLK